MELKRNLLQGLWRSAMFWAALASFGCLTACSDSDSDSDEEEKPSGGGSVEVVGSINGHEYVDLGLPSGVKWATCNVGADSPEDYGDYYAWGEVATKDTYAEGNSLTYGLSEAELNFRGIIDKDGNLTPAYDAASVNWGGSWRMPTPEEIDELLKQCSWTWTTMNGNEGYKVTGRNGNSIFLPAGGYRWYDGLYNAGSGGDYWSGSPYAGYDYDPAYDLYFGSDYRYRNVSYWISGLSVRPVCSGSKEEEKPGGGSVDVGGSINGHGYVNLGLSVKWAICNIGADSPEDYGDYYAWGEVATKDTYTGENSLTYGKSFSDLKSMGIIDEEGNLTPAYDAATANWGGSWRMPTSEEIDELRDECSWTWTTMNGKEGYRVTGTNGNSIFLPAGGGRGNDDLYDAGSSGNYWSSSPSTGDDSRAYGLYFSSGGRDRGWYYRCNGHSVRPVCP